ncbi:MAG: TolC family protein [Chlamydiia bacterium]|nr:TolC family protein [Chlamydiia bacterium]
MLRAFALFILLILQGCDVRGANDPYGRAPQSPDSIWSPTAKALRHLTDIDQLKKESEDYHVFSKEAPITLAEIIDIALARNPDTKHSWATARISAAEYGQSLKNYFIQADGTGNYTRKRYGAFVAGIQSIVHETVCSGELELSYTILDFGQTRMTSEAALQSLYNADWSHNSVIQQTIQRVMTDYYYYLYQKQLLFSSEQDVVNAKVSFDATEEKFKQGLADISDIVQARTQYLSAKLDVVSQKKKLHTSYTKLITDMGLSSDEIIYFQDYPEEISIFELETLDKLILKANENRPDLYAAEARVKSSLASYKAARLEKLPIVKGEFDIGRTYYGKGLNDTYDFTAQVNLTFPLFQGFFIENTIKKAKATLEKSEAALSEVRLAVIQEVANYRSDVGYAKESIEYAKAYLESAEEDFKVSLKKYQVGTGNIVDLINAQTAVADARSKLADAQNSYYTSIANLAYATGILFGPTTEKEKPYEKLFY